MKKFIKSFINHYCPDLEYLDSQDYDFISETVDIYLESYPGSEKSEEYKIELTERIINIISIMCKEVSND